MKHKLLEVTLRFEDWLFASALLNGTEDVSGSSPNQDKAQPSSSPSPDTRPASAPKRLNLLLVEDNLPDALLVREAIRMENLPIDIHAVTDGEQAIEFVERAETNPDGPSPHIVLLDLNLPKVDGFDVLRRIRASAKYKHVPVLVITSSDSVGDRQESEKLGARYFRKPPNYDEFLKVGKSLKRFLEENSLL